nr:hypothetical protein [Candidatus Sigynarchaeum springense]
MSAPDKVMSHQLSQGFGEDYKVALANTKSLFDRLQQRFGSAICGISVWGSVAEKYFMLPIDVTGLPAPVIKQIQAADLPIQGESRGSDIDATLYVTKAMIREVADYLGGIIDDLNKEWRFEHVMVAEYEAVLLLLSHLKQLFADVPEYKGLVHKVPAYFVISRDAQAKTPFKREERISETVAKFQLDRPYFEAAFLGFNHGITPELGRLLEITPEQRQFLADKSLKEMQSDAAYYAAYRRKKDRFVVLREILGTIDSVPATKK